MNRITTRPVSKWWRNFLNRSYFILFWLGRGGNVWLSPPGCAMFSIHVRVPATSWLGERIPFLQHIVSLAVVLAVRTKPGYEVRILWTALIPFKLSNISAIRPFLKMDIWGSVLAWLVSFGLPLETQPENCWVELLNSVLCNYLSNACNSVFWFYVKIIDNVVSEFSPETSHLFHHVHSLKFETSSLYCPVVRPLLYLLVLTDPEQLDSICFDLLLYLNVCW